MRRRAFAVLALVALLAAGGWTLRRHLPGEVHTASAAAHGATIVRYDIRSRHVPRTLAQTAAIPRGAHARPPLLVFLHGRGTNGTESDSKSDFYKAELGFASRRWRRSRRAFREDAG